ncbi:ABC transporter ATP-binding protein (plasmid) [Rhizobium sp. WL3]|uniref:ABC transporter ATP-binding protein n=1 Tax=Rhizobium sp. WL3 TaxID=2603277 RepID=UPI0011C1F992|nr:ABC transporter ATP-binding protein [Rhizobium sp. WL3]QEE43668.1 ABC transporter ATP-binding protein [Rhizobium sp. WL3]
MSQVALRVDGISKRYRLGGLQPYQTLRDTIVDFVRQRPMKQADKPEFWALRDVSFELKEGEVLGIVGRNGAGKSTLLKLLSRITTPDSGRIEVCGRIGSLLEVGTGFHPELTGRENIYMNGILLGMTRSEVQRKFDEIVDFSGVEEFLETPVKRYSSGMRVRLGFSVAAHLEPEILIVDEVLAVGDAEFQRKCLGRMNAAASEGRTVLFVSHQMEAIQSLCSRAVWLENGGVRQDGNADQVVSSYLASTRETARTELGSRTDRSGRGGMKVNRVEVSDGEGHPAATGNPSQIRIEFQSEKLERASVMVRIGVRDSLDRTLTLLSNELTGEELSINSVSGCRHVLLCQIPRLPLVPGEYALDIALWSNGYLEDKVFRATAFEVVSGSFFAKGKDHHVGVVHIDQTWIHG